MLKNIDRTPFPPFRLGNRIVTTLCLEETTSRVIRFQEERKDIYANHQFKTLPIRH